MVGSPLRAVRRRRGRRSRPLWLEQHFKNPQPASWQDFVSLVVANSALDRSAIMFRAGGDDWIPSRRGTRIRIYSKSNSHCTTLGTSDPQPARLPSSSTAPTITSKNGLICRTVKKTPRAVHGGEKRIIHQLDMSILQAASSAKEKPCHSCFWTSPDRGFFNLEGYRAGGI